MGQSVEQIKDRIFSFPDMKSELSPIASTSGKINTINIYQRILSNYFLYLGQLSQTSYSPAQVISLNTTETSSKGLLINPNKIFNEESISEDVLVQDLIYSFQSVEGKILKLDSSYGFQIDPVAKINRSQKQAVLRLSELGYLHSVVRKGLERMSVTGAGRVTDSFVAALHKELSEYYRFIAIMQEEVNR